MLPDLSQFTVSEETGSEDNTGNQDSEKNMLQDALKGANSHE